MEKVERAIDVLAHSGKAPSKVDVICEALEGLLDKIDPARRAERAGRRRAAKEGAPSGRKERVLGPTAVKYRVYLRGEGQCTYVDRQGKRYIC